MPTADKIYITVLITLSLSIIAFLFFASYELYKFDVFLEKVELKSDL